MASDPERNPERNPGSDPEHGLEGGLAGPGRDQLRARLYLPPAGAPPATAALVWVHGGAFVIGSLDLQEAHWPAIELAASGIPVLSVDYRMCINGVHYPEPQDDVLAAWRWATEHADELGVDPTRLHLGGGSAGGCLVAGAALRLRGTGQPQPASLFLGYPVLQGDTSGSRTRRRGGARRRDVIGLRRVGARHVRQLGRRRSAGQPVRVPRARRPAGLPPTYVLTCGRDTLRRASEPFADRLREAGVPVWHDLFAPPSMRHWTGQELRTETRPCSGCARGSPQVSKA